MNAQLMDLEEVENWTDFSYGGEGEKRLINSDPMGKTFQGSNFYGLRHVRKFFPDSNHWEHSEMQLVNYLGDPAWIHNNRPIRF